MLMEAFLIHFKRFQLFLYLYHLIHACKDFYLLTFIIFFPFSCLHREIFNMHSLSLKCDCMKKILNNRILWNDMQSKHLCGISSMKRWMEVRKNSVFDAVLDADFWVLNVFEDLIMFYLLWWFWINILNIIRPKNDQEPVEFSWT